MKLLVNQCLLDFLVNYSSFIKFIILSTLPITYYLKIKCFSETGESYDYLLNVSIYSLIVDQAYECAAKNIKEI